MTDEENINMEYKDVSERCAKLEQQIIGEYIAFLRHLALHYITQGVKVYFFENETVHWGKGTSEISVSIWRNPRELTGCKV